MTELTVFNFPTLKDGVELVEKKLCELLNKYREDKNNLEPEEIDYLDWANSALISID